MAGEGDAERLVVLLEARIRDFEKNMAKASGTAGKSYGGMRRDSKTATQQMEADMMRSTSRINQAIASTSTKIGSFGKSMIAGFAGGLVAGGIAGIVSRLGHVASGVASIGDEAKRAGLGVKAFQELKYVAEQNRIGVDALTDGIKELNLRADEFIVTGGGSAAEAFKRLGYSAEDLNTKLQDPSTLFTEIIGKLGQLDRAAQIRIADELFGGTGGEKFVQLIEQGEQGIRRTIDEAHALGIVLDGDLIAKAAEVDRKFNQIANTVGSTVKSGIVSATGALLDFIKAQDEAIRRNRLLSMDADTQNRHRETIAEVEAFLNATARVAPEAEAKVRELVDAVITGQKEASEVNTELREMGAMDEEFFPIAASLTGLLSLLDQLVGRSATARQELASLGDIDPITTGGAPATWEGIQSVFFPKPTTKPGNGGGGSGAASEAERQAKAVQNLIAGLEFERTLIGLSAVEQAKLNALRQAGSAATDEQRLYIENLVEATYREQAAADHAADSMERWGQIGTDAVTGLVDALADGKLEASELLNIVKNLVTELLTPMPGGSIFSGLGSLFGSGGFGMSTGLAGTSSITGSSGGFFPGFDGGGYTGSGPRSGGVDGKGGFPAILHPRETVIDHTKGQAGMAGGVSVVRVELGPDLEGRILTQTAGQAIQIVSAAEGGTIEKATASAGNSLASGDYRRGMTTYGLQQQARRR